uniref:hypothetical protein n=1 Tax=uncultured Sphingomonas sp. TaxID=158754 RepID=UPI0035CBC930
MRIDYSRLGLAAGLLIWVAAPALAQDRQRPQSDPGMSRGLDSGMPRGLDTGTPRGLDTGTPRGLDTGTPRGLDSGTPRGLDTGVSRARDNPAPAPRASRPRG